MENFENLKKLEETTYFDAKTTGDKMTGLGLCDVFDIWVASDIHETYVIELGLAAMEHLRCRQQ